MTTDTTHTTIDRREFGKGAAVGVMAGTVAMMGAYSHLPGRSRHIPQVAHKNIDIGECLSVKVTNISETSWFNNATLMGDIRGAGGLLVNQYTYNWPPFAKKGGKLAEGSYADGIAPIKALLPNDLDKAWEYQMENAVHPDNAGGFSALVEVTLLDGTVKRILLDSGWSYDWMDKAYQREKIDRMLADRKIDLFVISHEHFDHFWGTPVVFKYDPRIPTIYPEGFYQEGLQYIKDSGHRGELTMVKTGLKQLWSGVATYTFAIPIICRVYGEQSLYFNVKDLGLVCVTGCCHQGIIQFAQTALHELKFERFHGIYGGLHISPFEDWDPKNDDLVFAIGDYGFQKVGCNHCTGITTAKKFIDVGVNVVRGTARFRSKDPAYLGNGDTIEFSKAAFDAEMAARRPAA